MAQSEAVQNAVKAGDVVAVQDEVKISEKASPTGKAAVKAYEKLIAVNARGMAALCGGKIEPATPKPAEGKDERTEAQKSAGACDFFNYGFDLDVRASIRQELMGSLEGPEKTIKKAFDGMLLAGYDKATAAEMIRNSPKFKGVDGIENLLNRAAA